MSLTDHKISCEIKIDALENLEDPFPDFSLFTFCLSELPDINIRMQLLFITGHCTAGDSWELLTEIFLLSVFWARKMT